MDTDPVLLDACLFWGIVPGLGKMVIPEVDIKLQDCLLPHTNRRAMVEKIQTVTTNASCLHQGKSDYTCNSTLSPQINKDIRAD